MLPVFTQDSRSWLRRWNHLQYDQTLNRTTYLTRNTDHHERVVQELKQAGVRPIELHRHMFKLVPGAIRSDEHIEAVVYGLNEKHWHAVLIATDRRVVYIEADLMFSTADEFPYDIVHGVEQIHTPVRVGIKLKTKAGSYPLSYVNKDCAARFVACIEDRVEHMDDLASGFAPPVDPTQETNKKTHPYVDDSGQLDLPLAHIYDVQRVFLENHHMLTITNKSRKNILESQTLRYHMHHNALFAVAEQDIAQIYDLTKPLAATITDEASGRSMQLEVILKIELGPALVSEIVKLGDDVSGSAVYRLQILDLAFIAVPE